MKITIMKDCIEIEDTNYTILFVDGDDTVYWDDWMGHNNNNWRALSNIRRLDL